MTSSNGTIFRVTGPLCGEFTGPCEFPAQRPVKRSFDVFFDLRLNKQLVNNREAGDLRRHHAHYDDIVMVMTLVLNRWQANNQTNGQIFDRYAVWVKICIRQYFKYLFKTAT